VKVILYPDGRMVVEMGGNLSPAAVDIALAQAKRVQEAWASGEQKAIAVGPDVEVVVMQPDIDSRLARIEEALGLT
jgi:hypothetical protein